MARLSLSFLGPFQVTLDGQLVTRFESAKVRALLAYLAVESGHIHTREALSGLLWPDWPQSSALANLRYALSDLRQCIGDRHADPPFLLISREAIGWNPQSDYELDVHAFRQGIGDQGLEIGDGGDAATQLGSCVSLYRGRFLEGLSMGDSPAFEEWLRAQREHLEQRFLVLLQRLGEYHQRAGDYAQASSCAERQLALDPLREEAQRRLMRALALDGDRNAALARYQAYRATLSQELGAEPAPETSALYEQIRTGALVPPPSAATSQIQVGPIHELALPTPDEPPEAPRPLFVAREQELAQLERWLGDALRGQGRVGFVVGEPGSGKTMLLREFAQRAMQAHPDLVVASGGCNAYAGVGDPYLPFVEALRLLVGDIEAHLAAGTLSHEHARRLQELAPLALQAVLQGGPALIDVLIPGVVLLERARALPGGGPWEVRVQEVLDHRVVAPSQAFLFDQATRVLQAVARHRPLLLILDDLHWSDAASISLLFHLGRRLTGQRILMVGTYRPEEVAAGRGGQPHPLQGVLLELGAIWEENEVDLAQAEGRAFVEALVDSEPNALGTAFREALYRHTGGHALFSVELLRGLQQRGDVQRAPDGRWIEGPSLDWDRLPKRVEAVIAAHIARLPRDQQDLLSAASVEGEEFFAEVAARVLQRKEAEVLADLSGPLSQEHRLLQAASLRRVGEQRFSRYRFRHHLFQSYLYGRLDPVRRAYLHGEVAGALEGLGAAPRGAPDPTDTMANLADDGADIYGAPEPLASEATLAWHWEQAGEVVKAVLYHKYAARKAYAYSYVSEDAIMHNARAIDLLQALPQGPQRLRLEQDSYGSHSVLMAQTRGPASPERGHALRKCLGLAEKTGDPLLVAQAAIEMADYHRCCGELDRALALNERAVHLAQGGPPDWEAQVQSSLAQTRLHRADFFFCAQYWEPIYSALLLNEGSAFTYWEFVECAFHLPWPLWCLGYPDRALRVSMAVLEMYRRKMDDPRSGTDQAAADVPAFVQKICFIQQLRRDVLGMEESLRSLLNGLDDSRWPPWVRAYAPLYVGWAQAQRGDLEQGIETMRRGLAEWSHNLVIMRPYWKGYLAEALGRAGRADEGLQLLAEALEQVERTNERFNEAELWRLKGELLLQQGSPAAAPYHRASSDEGSAPVAAASCRALPDEPSCLAAVASNRASAEEAERCFRRAIAVAQGQEAKSWELRAAIGLARLLRDQGRPAEARDILSPIYGWFTEGFDTPDLQEAKVLLDDLR